MDSLEELDTKAPIAGCLSGLAAGPERLCRKIARCAHTGFGNAEAGRPSPSGVSTQSYSAVPLV